MTVDEMIRRKTELGYSYRQISELSGIPVGTVQKVLGGITKSPRRATITALEKVLADDDPLTRQREDGMNSNASGDRDTVLLREGASMYAYDGQTSSKSRFSHTSKGGYTLDDYDQLPDDMRVELIDGVIYDMAAPTGIHQTIAGEIYYAFLDFIKKNKGQCVTYMAPRDVQLDQDDKTMVQPDVMVICDRDKIKNRVVYGAPDLVVEILSDSTRGKDLITKTAKYYHAGVREYWIVDPEEKKITVYKFENDVSISTYDQHAQVPAGIFEDACIVDFGEIFAYAESIYAGSAEDIGNDN